MRLWDEFRYWAVPDGSLLLVLKSVLLFCGSILRALPHTILSVLVLVIGIPVGLVNVFRYYRVVSRGR